jgi:tetratricopeptide (TPR) repeat protein
MEQRSVADAAPGPVDPTTAGTIDDLVAVLRRLKVWAGDPSYDAITRRINVAWTAAGRPPAERACKNTVADCFRPGRRRLNQDLVLAIVRALEGDAAYLALWQRTLRMLGEHSRAAAQVQVHGGLPDDLAGFTGRRPELDRLRRASADDRRCGAASIFALVGMAGVGKTRLAVRAGHLLHRDAAFDHVLFVNLRGFHSDPSRPPADPGAVLDGFLRLLGVPARRIPHDVSARAAAYRARLAGSRCLVVLDNAADVEQVRPLLPATSGSVVLVTSRRTLGGLPGCVDIPVRVFSPDEAVDFLCRAAPGVPVGPDERAPARIVQRCGHLPLALGLISGHIRSRSGWTLSDHADRLDDRHGDGLLDAGIDVALDLSYRLLPADRQRLLRLVALHPGQDFDCHAAASIVGSEVDDVNVWLRQLADDHLLEEATAGRYTLHDLVRAHASGRAADDDPPAARRAALTRLFDYYAATAAVAMDVLAPAERHRRPTPPASATPPPAMAGLDAARAWLDADRTNLVAVITHAARRGWPDHAIAMSTALVRYLNGGHHADAFAVHGSALDAARCRGDVAQQAWALTHLAAAHLRLGQAGPAVAQLQQARDMFAQVGERTGRARACATLGDLEQRLGRYTAAAAHLEEALRLYRLAGDRTGVPHALTKLGIVAERLGRYSDAAQHHEAALALFRRVRDRLGEAAALCNLGDVAGRLRMSGAAERHLGRALSLYRRCGNRDGEAWTLDNLGALRTRCSRPDEAVEHHRRALEMHRGTGERHGEASALNGLGEAAHAARRPAQAFDHHRAAYAVAAQIGDRHQQGRALAGMAHAAHGAGQSESARRYYSRAVSLYSDLGAPEADLLRPTLAALASEAARMPSPASAGSPS